MKNFELLAMLKDKEIFEKDEEKLTTVAIHLQNKKHQMLEKYEIKNILYKFTKSIIHLSKKKIKNIIEKQLKWVWIRI